MGRGRLENTNQNISELIDKLFFLRRLMLTENARKAGLYLGQPQVLRFIKDHEGCLQVEIAAFLGTSAASVASSTRRLQNAGFVEKRMDSSDLRCNRMYLTDKGREAASQCQESACRADELLCQGFSQSELDVVASVLGRMVANISGCSENEVDLTTLSRTFRENNKAEDSYVE